jgi:ubiquinone/menaquinone biosynthesis C-methylase UbiE
MLPRVLEPEVMDTPEEARAYDEMDHREVNRVFVDDLLAAAGAEGVGREALDLGTGTAQIPIELCSRGGDVRVVAVDLSVSMLDLARLNVELAGLTRRIMLERVDAKGLPFAGGRFPCVMSNSIVHHIPQPRAALAEAWRVLAPGGLLFVRDLMRPADEATLDHLVATYAADCTEHQRKLFADSLHAALTVEELQEIAAEFGATPETVRQTSDRHWTWAVRKPP